MDLKRDLGIARIVVKDEVHRPALDAALLVHDPLEHLEFVLVGGPNERKRSGDGKHDVDVVRIGGGRG
jgi:hypothetical protein